MSTIGERFRKFGIYKFGSIKKFAESLEIQASNLQKYLSDQREPGTVVLLRASNLGCDLNWLLTGNMNPKIKKLITRINQVLRKNKLTIETINKGFKLSYSVDLSPDSLMSSDEYNTLIWELCRRYNISYPWLAFGLGKMNLSASDKEIISGLIDSTVETEKYRKKIISNLKKLYHFSEDEAEIIWNFNFRPSLNKELLKILEKNE